MWVDANKSGHKQGAHLQVPASTSEDRPARMRASMARLVRVSDNNEQGQRQQAGMGYNEQG